MVTYKDISNNQEVRTYIQTADQSLFLQGFTEHSFAHVTRVAEVAAGILSTLEYPDRTCELARISGFMHDIGNVINRVDHAQSGALMAYRILRELGMPPTEVATVITAIGNHDEGTSAPVVGAVAAALILGDKSDVRKSRVRNQNVASFDIHDRVNYAVEHSSLITDKKAALFTLKLSIDNGTMLDYFEIFLGRMLLCRRAASFFSMQFALEINGTII